MSIAQQWRRERGGRGGSSLDGEDRSASSVKPHQLDGVPPSEKKRRRGHGKPSADAGARILRMVAERQPAGDFSQAAFDVARGIRKRVTFRDDAVVKAWPTSERDQLRHTFDELEDDEVEAGARGTTVSVMVDGRDVVKMDDDGRQVLARVGVDCRLLGWWYRVVDRLKGRRLHP